MLKAYKFRIYPTHEQQQNFCKHFGCARFVYNWGLHKKQEHYKNTGKGLSKRAVQDAMVALKKDSNFAWLNEVNSQTLLASLGNLHEAFTKFFHKRAKFPKFKKKYAGRQTYQCPQHVGVDFERGVIDLPKIKGIKATLHRRFAGKIKTCTIEKTPANKFFISILVETLDTAPTRITVEPALTIGIDLGIKELLTTSDGYMVPNNRFLQNSNKLIRKLQRRLAKKVKNSKNRIKAKYKLARAFEKTANKRLDLLHQVSSKLVYKIHATSIAIEDLHVKGMMKNHKLSKAIGDCGWGILLRLLDYKTTWSGKNLIKIDRWSPSSKQCSGCGFVKDELSLSERVYCCSSCNLIIDRDINAAINIKNVALLQLGQELPEDKLVDHALAGIRFANLATHGLKQEAATRDEICVANLA